MHLLYMGAARFLGHLPDDRSRSDQEVLCREPVLRGCRRTRCRGSHDIDVVLCSCRPNLSRPIVATVRIVRVTPIEGTCAGAGD